MEHHSENDNDKNPDIDDQAAHERHESCTTSTTKNNDEIQPVADDAEDGLLGAATDAAKNNDNTSVASPRITNIKWGCVDVENRGNFKDVKLYPGVAESWDWETTNTHHKPGIQPADISELLSHGCKIIILSRGMENMLQTSAEARELLKNRGMEEDKNYFILESKEAVERYNEFVEKKEPVGALIHSTC